jgi:hypothetical protein
MEMFHGVFHGFPPEGEAKRQGAESVTELQPLPLPLRHQSLNARAVAKQVIVLLLVRVSAGSFCTMHSSLGTIVNDTSATPFDCWVIWLVVLPVLTILTTVAPNVFAYETVFGVALSVISAEFTFSVYVICVRYFQYLEIIWIGEGGIGSTAFHTFNCDFIFHPYLSTILVAPDQGGFEYGKLIMNSLRLW